MLRPDSILALSKCRDAAHNRPSESPKFDEERRLLFGGHMAYCACTIALESVQCVKN